MQYLIDASVYVFRRGRLGFQLVLNLRLQFFQGGFQQVGPGLRIVLQPFNESLLAFIDNFYSRRLPEQAREGGILPAPFGR